MNRSSKRRTRRIVTLLLICVIVPSFLLTGPPWIREWISETMAERSAQQKLEAQRNERRDRLLADVNPTRSISHDRMLALAAMGRRETEPKALEVEENLVLGVPTPRRAQVSARILPPELANEGALRGTTRVAIAADLGASHPDPFVEPSLEIDIRRY